MRLGRSCLVLTAAFLVLLAACGQPAPAPPLDEAITGLQPSLTASNARPTPTRLRPKATRSLDPAASPSADPLARPANQIANPPTSQPAARSTSPPTVQPTPLLADESDSTQPTAQPTTSPAPMEPASPPLSGLAVWEQDITLDTYAWQEALLPTAPDDPVYPYPRLDFDAVTGPVPRAYRAVFVQNAYVQLVVVPELGGRILRWTDRTTGRQLFYANPVIKPTHWGRRGWWLATGGLEWAFPTEEHGLNEYQPWQYELLGDGVRVWDTDDRTGLQVEVMIRLDRQHSYFTLIPRITNPTPQPQPYQFWANAMLALSDTNVPSPELVFILPDDAVTVHATGDGSLPSPGGHMAWPLHNGRDFSRYSQWHRYLGVFANPAQAGFVGAYDLGDDQGMVRIFPPAVATGVKIFCLGDLPSTWWTDDGSRYFELWGGLTPTFWEDWTLQPGASVSWTERWYPVSAIGGYNWANEEAAIRLVPSGEQAEVAVVTSRAFRGVVVLRQGGMEVQRWDATISPGQPFHATGGPASGSGDWGVQVLEDSAVVAHMGP